MEEENKVEQVNEVETTVSPVEEPIAEPVVETTVAAAEEANVPEVTENKEVVEEPVVKTEEKNIEQAKDEQENKNDKKEKKKNRWWIPIALFVVMVIIILLLLTKCGKGDKKYKIKIHNGDEIIEVDKDFKLSELEVDGGIVGFLVDSGGHVADPSKDLDPEKEYSVHIIPEGKEKVKVTYVNGDYSFTVEYQKGAGLLFPEDPTKDGYVFIGWKDEEIDDYPLYMSPVNKDMTLVAQFEKTVSEGGKCTLNCDTNKDGICDLNCDTNGDGKPDKNVDKDGDGICDLNCDSNHDGVCDLNCDTDGDENPDKNVDKDGDGICDLNCDYNHDGKCDFKCDTDGDGVCDLKCDTEGALVSNNYDATIGCSTSLVHQMTKKGKLISTTINGKEVEPDEITDVPESKYKWPTWYLKEYKEKGEPIEVVIKGTDVDEVGQIYYYIYTTNISFIGKCNKPEPTPNQDPNPNPEPQPEPQPGVTYTCPDGYQLSGDKCNNNVTVSKEAEVSGYSCQDGFTYDASDGRCHKQEEQGCPAGYNNGPNGCERIEYADFECGHPYVVAYGKCCWNNTDGDNSENCPGRVDPHCPDGYYRSNSGDRCETWLYDAQRGCYNANSTEIPGSFLCDTIGTTITNYSCSTYGNDYVLNGDYCVKSYTETIDATRN